MGIANPHERELLLARLITYGLERTARIDAAATIEGSIVVRRE